MRKHHVVIIGSGFGGLFAAKALRRADVDVTLIARTTHHLFQPLLYQVATGILSEGEIAPATREVLRKNKNVTVQLGLVEGIDASHKSEGNNLHQSVLGHSYGSTTLGYALTQVRDGVVDAGVFYGPPGVPAKDVSDFNVPSDSVYVMKNDQDIIGAVPNKGPMGMAPGSDMTQLSDPTEVPGIQHIEGNHGIDPGTGLVTGILGPIAGAGYEGYQDHVNYFDSTNYQDADTQKEIHKYLRQQGLPETDENVRAEIQRRQQENATSQQREVSRLVNGTK